MIRKILCICGAILFLIINKNLAQSNVADNISHLKMNGYNLQDTIFKYTNFYPNGTQLAIAFIENGKVKFFRGIIRQNDTLKDVDNKDSVFMIGSITKVFTSTLLARAVVNHQVNLDETVDKIVGYPLKDNVQITLKQLSNHTSGLPRLSNKIAAIDAAGSSSYGDFSDADLKTDLTDSLKLLSQPGTKYAYSNFGVSLLGYLLSKVENLSYEEMLQQQILEPLNMTRSTTDRNKIKDYIVKGLTANGSVAKTKDFSEIYKGCGAIYSSVNDLSKFLVDNFRNNEVYSLVHQPTFQTGDRRTIALVWDIFNYPKRTVYWHGGLEPGYRSCMSMNLKSENGIIILSNVGHNKLGNNIDALCFRLNKIMDE